ncbi:MAG TPA: hypothetical protein VJN71_02885 [Nitrososphaerales archaeon]|nr:hypothetical protein [Nitrososphaerales archaeon]
MFQDKRWKECREFLKKVETGEIRASTSDFALYSSIIVIESKAGKRADLKIETFLAVLSSLKGLSILRPTTIDMNRC